MGFPAADLVSMKLEDKTAAYKIKRDGAGDDGGGDDDIAISKYSNEGNEWRKSHIEHISKHEIKILIKEKFVTERGRINCSLQENSGKWRWLGIQYVIAEY